MCVRGFLVGAAGLLAALCFLFRGLHWALDRWAKDWKIYGQEDWASLAVLLLLLKCCSSLHPPPSTGSGRMQEHAADVYGLEVIHGLVPNSEEVAAHAFQVLGELDLADPNPPAFIKILALLASSFGGAALCSRMAMILGPKANRRST